MYWVIVKHIHTRHFLDSLSNIDRCPLNYINIIAILMHMYMYYNKE